MAFQVQIQKAKIAQLQLDPLSQYVKMLLNTVQIKMDYPIALQV
jgi:hypothetical protein